MHFQGGWWGAIISLVMVHFFFFFFETFHSKTFIKDEKYIFHYTVHIYSFIYDQHHFTEEYTTDDIIMTGIDTIDP